MIITLASQFHNYLPWVNSRLACLILNVKALVGAFNQKKALVGAFSAIVKTSPLPCGPQCPVCGVYWLISVNGSLTPWFRWIYWFWQPSQSLNPIKPDPDNFLILPLIPRLTFKTHESFMSPVPTLHPASCSILGFG